jgi:phospholipid/cholesterol/gamma-HCH transport system permease protein
MWLFWPAYSAHDVTLSGYNSAMQLIRLPPDLYWLCAKAALTGLLIGIVCCYKGLHTSGGSEGVGRAVNEAVLITVAGVYAIDVLGNLAFYAWFPHLTVLRG